MRCPWQRGNRHAWSDITAYIQWGEGRRTVKLGVRCDQCGIECRTDHLQDPPTFGCTAIPLPAAPTEAPLPLPTERPGDEALPIVASQERK